MEPRLPQEHRPGGAERLDDRGILRRGRGMEAGMGPGGRPIPLYVDQVLHSDGDAVKRPPVEPRAQFPGRRLGRRPGFVPEDLVERVQLGVLALDAVQEHLRQGLRGEFPRAELSARFRDAVHAAHYATIFGTSVQNCFKFAPQQPIISMQQR